MKEIDLHRLIEAQNQEKKAEVWQKVQDKLKSDTHAAAEMKTEAPQKKFGRKKIVGFASLAAV